MWPLETCCAHCLKLRKNAGIDSCTTPRPQSFSKVVTWMRGRTWTLVEVCFLSCCFSTPEACSKCTRLCTNYWSRRQNYLIFCVARIIQTSQAAEIDLRWTSSHLNTLDFLCTSFPSALEHFKRWLIPEKVAISAEELEYLLRPSQNKEPVGPDQTQNREDTEGERHDPEDDDSHSPEKWVC